MRSVQFFNTYFSSFPALLLADILFIPFDLLAAGYCFLMYRLFGGLNIAVSAAALIILNVGMAGVSLVCRYVCTGKGFSVPKAFVKGLKENALRCFIHGVLFYVVFAVSFLSISLYYSGTKSSGIFWVPLVITALIALGVLFASYYMNVMTVTMDISLRDIYRNCFLFSFGELKNNLFATAALLIFGAVIFTIAYIINNMWAILLVLGLLQLFIIPSTVQYIITFYTYDDMVAMLDGSRRSVKTDEEDDALAEPAPTIDRQEAEDISRKTSDSRDEYIFYNGRMIKRSEVEKLLEDE